MKLSLRDRLILTNFVILTALLLSLGLVARGMVERAVMGSIDSELQKRIGPWTRADRPPPPGFGGPGQGGPGGQQGLDGGPGGPGDLGGPPRFHRPNDPRVLKADGGCVDAYEGCQPLDSKSLAKARANEPEFTYTADDNQRIRIITQSLHFPGMEGQVVQAGYPLEDADRQLREFGRTLLLMFPLALIAAAAGSALMTQRVLGSMRQTTVAAEAISAEDMTARLPVVGEDEFAKLSGAFNGLLDRLQLSFEQQQQLVQQLRAFTADASHELKTPLTVIRGNATLGLEGDQTTEEYKLALREIDKAASSMSSLVEDLLILARADAGFLARHKEPTELGSLCESVVQSVTRMPGATISFEASDKVVALVDHAEIERVLLNLLKNAREHTPDDGTVSVTLSKEADDTVITVSDSGRGIEAEHLASLGNRFYRVDEARDRDSGGAGLGLSICRSIVEAHGGQMLIESKVGKGTQVQIRLPLGTD